ncbi:MAG: hypothetical protein KH921_08055 [Erysipelotrichaceae bacterium]|nr:hypothetical protein [Erysipelotrichaceae bacterium]
MWGGSFWTNGYFVKTAGASGREAVIRNQELAKQLPRQGQVSLTVVE